MRTKTRRIIVSAIGGACTGALVVFIGLAVLGSRSRDDTEEMKERPESSATPLVTAEPPVSPSPEASPESSPRGDIVVSGSTVSTIAGGYQFSLPPGYRVAHEITSLERSQIPSATPLTLTRGSKEEERQYVALIEQLRRDQTATEAPVFLPGKTLTILKATDASEGSDRQLSRAQEPITMRAGLKGTRYRRVEGLFTYDAVYLTLPSGVKIVLQMSYGSEDPLFDEQAYQTVLTSLKIIEP